MEKQVVFTDLKAVFLKDHDTFSKMDPFLVFKIGKSQGKTETASDAGKEPAWKENITLVYFDEPQITVTAFEQDMTIDRLGEAKIDVKSLKTSGELSIQIENEGSQVGIVICKYTMKTLPPTPILFVKNIKCDFFQETKFMLKTTPYFAVKCGEHSVVTEAIEEGDARKLAWDETIRITIKDGDQLHFNVYDKDDNKHKIFGYETTTKEFRTLSGSKQFNVIDKSFKPLGTLSFDYETKNFVSKEESLKNEEAAKKGANEMNLITIEKIKGKLNEEGEDIYFKIVLGPNAVRTKQVKNSKKDFEQELNQQFYAQKKQNRIVFAAYDLDMVSDDFLGTGSLELEGITTGERTVSLHNKDKQHFGDIILVLKVQKVVCKSIQISDVKIKLTSSADIIGKNEPYIISRIGGWSARTEVGDGNEYSFKKGMQLKFSQETELTMQVWDQDLNNDDKLFLGTVKLEDLKAEGGDMTISLSKQGNSQAGELFFKYATKNIANQNNQKTAKEEEKKSTKDLGNKAGKQEGNKSGRQEGKQEKNKTGRQEGNKKPTQKIESRKSIELKNSAGDESSKEKQKKEVNFHQNQHHMEQSPRLTGRSSLDRSKNTVKLPLIPDSKNYGDRIFEKQSAATLQQSILVYSMPKANRFSFGPKYQGQPSYYVDTAFKPNSGKGVGFGFGSKRQFPDWMQRNMKQNPAPGAYFDHHNSTSPGFRPKGPTFGIGYKYYEKVTIPHEKNIPKSMDNLKPLKTRRPMKLNQ